MKKFVPLKKLNSPAAPAPTTPTDSNPYAIKTWERTEKNQDYYSVDNFMCKKYQPGNVTETTAMLDNALEDTSPALPSTQNIR